MLCNYFEKKWYSQELGLTISLVYSTIYYYDTHT